MAPGALIDCELKISNGNNSSVTTTCTYGQWFMARPKNQTKSSESTYNRPYPAFSSPSHLEALNCKFHMHHILNGQFYFQYTRIPPRQLSLLVRCQSLERKKEKPIRKRQFKFRQKFMSHMLLLRGRKRLFIGKYLNFIAEGTYLVFVF